MDTLLIIKITSSALGLFIAWYIWHKKRHNEKVICYVGQKCDAVLYSSYAKFLGLPIENLGILYYFILLFGYGAHSAFPDFGGKIFIFALFIVSGAGFLFSIYLTLVQLLSLKEFCTWCLTSAFLTSLIFISAIASLEDGLSGFLLETRPVILMIHVLAMALGIGLATVTDIFFFKFLKDFKISHFEKEVLRTLSQVIWLALGLVIISGIGLFLPYIGEYSESSKFIVKMLIVAVLILNGAVLNLFITPRLTAISFGGHHIHIPGELHYARKISFALGAVSIISWYTAFILGSLRSIPFSASNSFLIYLGLLVVGITGSQIMERNIAKKGEVYNKIHGQN